jgi:hypothetical protein
MKISITNIVFESNIAVDLISCVVLTVVAVIGSLKRFLKWPFWDDQLFNL